MKQDLGPARRRAYELMRDGREDLLLSEFDANPLWADDPYLLRLRGNALWLADRLNEAEACYRKVLTLPGAEEDKEAVRRELASLEQEWQLVRVGRSALSRARWSIAGGVAIAAGLTWFLARRGRLRLTTVSDTVVKRSGK